MGVVSITLARHWREVSLEDVRALVEQGAVRPLIEAVYSLDEVAAAHKHVETGPSRGNVVVTCDND